MPTKTADRLPRRRIAVIRNPIAGDRAASRFQAVLAALEARGCEVQVRETTHPNEIRELAAGISADAFDLVAAAGGDGTVNQVANGLAADAPPLGIIPLGTTNVLALEIGIPDNPSEIARIFAEGPSRPIHPGVTNGRRFLMVAGAGLDAHVIERTTPELKKWIGKRAYTWQGFKCFVQHPQGTYQVNIDGKVSTAAAVFVSNMRYYGGPYVLAPEASLEAPGFHVCLFRKPGRLNVARYGLALLAGRLPRLPDVEIIRGTSVVIEGRDNEPVQADGDIVGRLPITIETAPAPLQMIFPR